MMAVQLIRTAEPVSALLLLLGLFGLAGGQGPLEPPQYNRDIRPILSDKCFRCHGPDAAQRQADLRLDQLESKSAAFHHEEPIDAANETRHKNAKSAIVAKRPEESELFRRITTASTAERMPPIDSGSELSAGEIELLRRWIASGAEVQPHWSFVAPRRVPLPQVANGRWPTSPIDSFILARLEREGVTPSPLTDRATWLRRVSLDLIGLPPSVAELDAFLADESHNAYEAVVDRLLQSPHFGERMALDWLDGARYADTNGFFSDLERPIWRWREWVIDAFNRNQPFDEFTIEQLAGDLLPEATIQQKIATGFHRNHMVTNETGIIDEEYRVEYVADRVETTGAIWLGLTIGCARCHDHKYDPVSQREYYELYAFFNSVPEKGLVSGDPLPILKFETAEYIQEQATRRTRRAASEKKFQEFAAGIEKEQAAWESSALATLPQPSREQLVAELRFEDNLSNSAVSGQAADSVDPAEYEPGIRGSGLKFATPFFATLDPQLSLDSDQPWTISVWFSVENASLACVLAKMESNDDSRGLEIIWLKGRLKIGLIHRRDENAIQVVTRQPAKSNRWHHLALSYDGYYKARGLQVFLDGVKQDVRVDRDTLTNSIANDRPWFLGRKDDGLGFTGRIDQFRLYRRAVPAEEIAQALCHGEEISGILETAVEKRTSGQPERLKDYFIRHHASPAAQMAWDEMHEAQHADKQWAAEIPKTLVMEELAQARETFVLKRGQYDQPGEKVEANVPRIFPPLASGPSRNRLALAKWLVQPNHPLTSRVIVNRYWSMLFGEGLVKTNNDFGLQGELPSHPELLDWLAVDFVESGWDVKRLLKQLVLSATYRQSSGGRADLIALDPENRLLARGPRFRLQGELIRDQALAASGLLSRSIGGPSVKPYQPPGLWEAVSYDGESSYAVDSDASLYRRSLYTYWKRQAPPPTMLSFDSPTRETCTVKRPRTNTPLQALVLLNDPTYIEAARRLAENVLRTDASPEGRVRRAFRQAVARNPEEDEVVKLVSLQQQQWAAFRLQPEKARRLISVGASTPDSSLDQCELAAWTIAISVLLNLDEVITKP